MRVHHIGFVVADIDRYRRTLPVEASVRRLYDPVQRAELELIDAGRLYLELIAPRDERSFTWNFLQKGGGYHHLCYEVENEEEAEAILGRKRMIRILGPVDAPLLEGRVMFAYGRNKEVVEFLWHE